LALISKMDLNASVNFRLKSSISLLSLNFLSINSRRCANRSILLVKLSCGMDFESNDLACIIICSFWAISISLFNSTLLNNSESTTSNRGTLMYSDLISRASFIQRSILLSACALDSRSLSSRRIRRFSRIDQNAAIASSIVVRAEIPAQLSLLSRNISAQIYKLPASIKAPYIKSCKRFRGNLSIPSLYHSSTYVNSPLA